MRQHVSRPPRNSRTSRTSRTSRGWAAKLAVVVAAAALLAPAASVAAEEGPLDWNQAEVTKLAGELETKVAALRKQVRSELRANTERSQSTWRFQLADTMRVIEREVKHLHARLQEGATREQTAPVFERVERLRIEARGYVRRMYLSDAIEGAIRETREVWLSMAPYYDRP